MNGAPGSVTLAYLLVFASLAYKHGWWSKVKIWIQAPPAYKAPEAVGTTLNDWQAAIVSYVILIFLSETETMEGIAVALAWAIGLIEAMSAVQAGAANPQTWISKNNAVQGSGSAGIGGITT